MLSKLLRRDRYIPMNRWSQPNSDRSIAKRSIDWKTQYSRIQAIYVPSFWGFENNTLLTEQQLQYRWKEARARAAELFQAPWQALFNVCSDIKRRGSEESLIELQLVRRSGMEDGGGGGRGCAQDRETWGCGSRRNLLSEKLAPFVEVMSILFGTHMSALEVSIQCHYSFWTFNYFYFHLSYTYSPSFKMQTADPTNWRVSIS